MSDFHEPFSPTLAHCSPELIVVYGKRYVTKFPRTDRDGHGLEGDVPAAGLDDRAGDRAVWRLPQRPPGGPLEYLPSAVHAL